MCFGVGVVWRRTDRPSLDLRPSTADGFHRNEGGASQRPRGDGRLALPLPYCTVYRARDLRGTMTDVRGFFSLPALEGDTLEFSSVGYVTHQAIIPAGSEMGRVNLVQPMGRDTVNMADAFVYPWPSKERFKKEFLALGLPNQGLDPAWDANMDPLDMYDRLIEVGRDGQSTATDVLSAQAIQAGYSGQATPVNLLNPVAWAKFLQALRDGDLKRQ